MYIYYIDCIYFCVNRAVDDFVDTNVDDGLDDILSQALEMLENKTSEMTENYVSFYDSSRKDCIALYKEKRQDHRLEVGEERSLIDLALESTPENTKKSHVGISTL